MLNFATFCPPSQVESAENSRQEVKDAPGHATLGILLTLSPGFVSIDSSSYQNREKTTLLWHYAYQIASQAKRVVYIASKARISATILASTSGLAAKESVLKMIEMRYQNFFSSSCFGVCGLLL